MKQFSLTKTKTNCKTKQPIFGFHTPSNCDVHMYHISAVPNLTLLHFVQRKLKWSPLLQCELLTSGIHWADEPPRTSIFFSRLTPLQNTKLLQGKSLKTLHENKAQTFSRHKQIGCFGNFPSWKMKLLLCDNRRKSIWNARTVLWYLFLLYWVVMSLYLVVMLLYSVINSLYQEP